MCGWRVLCRIKEEVWIEGAGSKEKFGLKVEYIYKYMYIFIFIYITLNAQAGDVRAEQHWRGCGRLPRAPGRALRPGAVRDLPLPGAGPWLTRNPKPET
jgi:hypothetical protein